MTIQILLPTGTAANLSALNLHDMQQYYMHQMDMLEQAEDALSGLGIEGWRDGVEVPVHAQAISRKRKPASEFCVAPAEGNSLPTHYDATTWQGIVRDEKGYRSYPYISEMTAEQIKPEIKRQQKTLANFQVSLAPLVNLARNIAAGTQPPVYPLSSEDLAA